MTMWHGGAPGRGPGDPLLPPSITGFTPTNAELTGPPPRGKRAHYRDTLVYATTDRVFAEMWAHLYTTDPKRPGDGVVYEVELASPTPDPDLQSSGSAFQASEGMIVGEGTPVTSSLSTLDEVLRRYRETIASAREVNTRRREARAKSKTASKSRRRNRKP